MPKNDPGKKPAAQKKRALPFQKALQAAKGAAAAHTAAGARTGEKGPLKWSRLDNAAKIFPPTVHGANTGVFRLSCETTEQINPELLQRALNETLRRFPHFQMVMRRGLFWYYLEQTLDAPLVAPEHAPPCAPLYQSSRSPLFEVSYWRGKINIDVFHVLADGSGAIAFFQALITRYLLLCHPEIVLEDETAMAGPGEKGADSFQKYYKPHAGAGGIGAGRAYHLHGPHREDRALRILEGVADVRQVLEAAHRYGATLTVFLTAALIQAIHGVMYVRHEKKPVVLTVPVDLRSYFPSDTARNFFGTIRVGYQFKDAPGTMEDIVASVGEQFRAELTTERLSERMNRMAAIEHNPFVRPVPLALKNLALAWAGRISDTGETAALSNVGGYQLPEVLHPFVRGFSAFMSTDALQLCTCTFESNLHFGFTSALQSTEVQRRFFEILTQQGVALTVRSNEYHKEEG